MIDYQTFTDEQRALLQSPLDATLIKHRPGGGGRMLKYMSGDSAIDAANRIFGFGQWGYRVIARSHEVIEDEKKGRIEFYTADIELSVVGAAFPFPGDGVGVVNAPYTVEMHEKARKEAATDALKRALRHYGDQFGLCLYNEDDYVDAGDGTLIPVKDVKPAHKTPQKRIVEAQKAPRQIEQAKSSPVSQDAVKSRLNALYSRAKAIGVAANSGEFLAFIGHELGMDVVQPTMVTMENLDDVEEKIVLREQKAS